MNAVISMTTIPSRVKYLERCVDALLAQGLPVYVWLPRYVERIGGGFNDVPGFLRKMDVHVEIVEDRGPATKLLPALERFETVLTADDDHEYGKRWASDLLEWADKRPDAALAYRGRKFRESLCYNDSIVVRQARVVTPVHLITGVHGALYHRGHFGDSIFTDWKKWKCGDDIVISGHLWQRGVPLLVVPRQCSIRRMDAHAIDPLYAKNVHEELNDEGLCKIYQGWTKS